MVNPMVKERLETLLKLRTMSGYRSEVVLHGLADEIIKILGNGSNIKERLYRAIIKRELKDKYEESRYGTSCIKCGKIATLKEGILVQGHYRKCPTAQLERVLAI